MAVAKCGKLWSWDSPWWCSGKKIDERVDKMCERCPWWKGNQHSILDSESDSNIIKY